MAIKNLTAWDDITQGKLMDTTVTIDSNNGDLATSGAVSMDRALISAGEGSVKLSIVGSDNQATNITFVMPDNVGTEGQVLVTDGNGVLSFTPNGIQSVVAEDTNAITITGTTNLTIALNAELEGLSGLAANGLVGRTATGTYANRTLTAGESDNISITNGNGVAGNPIIELASEVTLTTLGTTNLNFQFMTTATRDAITSPSVGAIVCVSDDSGTTSKLCVWTGAAWQTIAVV